MKTKQYMCPKCDEYISITNWHDEIIKCPVCGIVILKRQNIDNDQVNDLSIKRDNEKIQQRIINEELLIKEGKLNIEDSFKIRHKSVLPILRGHGIIV